MKLVFSLLVLLCLSAVLSFIVTMIYLAFYNNYLSKRITNGIKNKNDNKKLIEPVKLFFIGFLVFNILSCFFISVKEANPIKTKKSVQLELCGGNSLINDFSSDGELSGYTRYEKNFDDISCIYYVNNDENSVFPYLLIHIDSDSKYSFDYHINDVNNISSADNSVSADKSEWYALKDAPEPCTLVISFKTSSDNNTVNIKL